MKHLIFSFTAVCLMMAACTADIAEPKSTLESGNEYTLTMLPMRLIGDIQQFDEVTTRASTSTTSWEEGDSLFLQFGTGTAILDGFAVFKNGEWQAAYFGTLAASTGGCRIYRFSNIAAQTTADLSLTARSAVYADTLGTYILEGGVLTLSAHLAPLTGRLRFKGNSGQKVTFNGLKWNSHFTFKGALKQQTGTLTLTAGSDGYTPYVYGTFADATNRDFTVELNEDYACTRRFGSNVLATGKSGYLNLPTMDNRSGWTLTDPMPFIFTVIGNAKSVTITMNRVQAGNFLMGSNKQSDEQPIHQVTLTKGYYMATTEVTNALWYAVMGSSPNDQKNAGDNCPVSCVSYEDITKASTGFLPKLNTMLANQLDGKQFRLPTEAEWEYAARGGHRQNSPNYTYAGSNTIGEVAWYTENSSSTTHPVGQKKANELGLYDMSGNVREWCADWFDSSYYSNSPSTDPTGPTSGSYRVSRGGCWDASASNSRVAYRSYYTPSFRSVYLGFRLAL